MKIRIKKLLDTARVPEYAHPGDAGMDLFAAEAMTLAPGERVGIRSGLAFELPEGYVGLIWDKSGLSFKHGLHTYSGVLDAGYRGELVIGMRNLSEEPYTFEVGDKVAQMLIQPVARPTIEEADTLTESVRGTGGFGSAGK
jgi:dUTP pyrophosphatase